MLNDQSFMRYSRQLLLEEFGPDGQEKIDAAKVLIVGLGGLGSPASLYLAAAGVGKLTLADDDSLHISNLQRQVIYRSADVDKPKAAVAKRELLRLNPECEIVAIEQRLEGETLTEAVRAADLVLDCSDNMATRHAINQACVENNKTLISGSAVGFSGQLLVLEPPYSHGCYACLYPDHHTPVRNCRTAGGARPSGRSDWHAASLRSLENYRRARQLAEREITPIRWQTAELADSPTHALRPLLGMWS
ncbi:sulfur carrier protein ThiS adenylyltransferase [Ewingella americana]